MKKYKKPIVIAMLIAVGIVSALYIDIYRGFNKCRHYAAQQSLSTGNDRAYDICKCMESELNLYEKLKFAHSDSSSDNMLSAFIKSNPNIVSKVGQCVSTRRTIISIF